MVGPTVSPNRQKKEKNVKVEVAGPVVVFDAVGELTVVLVAAGAISVALVEEC